MWNKLKEAKTFKDFYGILGEDFFLRGFFGFLFLLVLLPGIVALMNLLVGSLFVNSEFYEYDYRPLFILISGLSLLFFIFYLLSKAPGFRAFFQCLHRFPWLFLFLILLLWMGLCTLFSRHPWKEFTGNYYRLDGYLSYLFYGVFFYFAYRVTLEKKRLLLLHFLMFSGVFMGIIMLLQSYEVSFIVRCFPEGKAASFNNLNHLGYFLITALLVSAGLAVFEENKKWRLTALFSFVFLSYALIINNTFGSYLAALFVMLFLPVYGAFRGRPYLICSLLLTFIFLALSVLGFFDLLPVGVKDVNYQSLFDNFRILFSDMNAVIKKEDNMEAGGSGRIILWIATWKAVLERPVFGWGPDAFYWDPLPGCTNPRPHNEYLQWLAYGGFPALLFYLSGLITLAVRSFKLLKKLSPAVLAAGLGIIAYLISAFFGNTFFYTVPYLWLLLGLVAGAVKEAA